MSELDEAEVARFVDAAHDGDMRKVRAMVAKGIPVDAATTDGSTGLMEAANRGHLDLVKFLLEHGANVHARDAFGDTALAMAAKGSKNLRVFQYLYRLARADDRKRVERVLKWKRMLPEQYPQWQMWKPPKDTAERRKGSKGKKKA
jgi:hypothetical protein